MDSLQTFSDALADLERILTAMADTSRRTDPNWKREFIEMRRQLQLKLTAVATAADRCEKIKIDTKAAAELREGWTRMRSALALHQANWPAVRIDRADPGYVDSVRKTRATNGAFVELARKIIIQVRQRDPSTRAGAFLDPKSIPGLDQLAGTPVSRMPEAGTL